MRVNDLQITQNQIVYNYWTQKGKLPAGLDDLQDDVSGFRSPIDPESGAAYEYRVIDPKTFELCAEFKTSSEKFAGKKYLAKQPAPYYEPYNQSWGHAAERTCFTRKIDPELYKVKTNEIPAMPR